MAEHDRFDSLTRYLSRSSGDKTGPQLMAGIHEAFVSCMPQLPEDLKHDIAFYFEGIVSQAGHEQPAVLLVGKLNEALHLLEGEYDRIEKTFTTADWEYIKDVMSDFALEIDQQTLAYIMGQIVSRGIIGG